MFTRVKNLALAAALFVGSVQADPINFEIYNPGEKGIFAVTSTLVTTDNEAMLVDAQFGVKEGQDLVEMIRKSGKELTLIYISGGDPDFYFGLEPVVAAFPDVKIVASQSVVDHIHKTKDLKLKYWGPILGENAPQSVIVPEVFNGERLSLEGEEIEVKEINTHQAYLWAPAVKTAFGGVLVTSGQHIWTADTQTQSERMEWVAALERLLDLNPVRVVPGHFKGELPEGDKAVRFNRDYLMAYDKAIGASANSDQLMDAMHKLYPDFAVDQGFKLSAKVSKGEIQWP